MAGSHESAGRRLRPRAAWAALPYALLGVLLCADPAPAQPPAAIPPAANLPEARLVQKLTIAGDLGTGKERRSLSGIACATPPGLGPRACILAGDENDLLWSATLDGKTIRLEARIHPAEGATSELDLEAAAFVPADTGGAYYVTGSHGASRKEGRYEAARYQVFRIPADPATGAPAPGQPVARTGALAGIIAGLPKLAGVACRAEAPCRRLDDDGVTIEGMAARDGALYFGLRNTMADGTVILKVPAAGLFSATAPRAEVLRVRLHAGDGVRDLAAVAGGFLILAGLGRSDDDLAQRHSVIHFWDGRSDTTRPLAQIVSADDAKPEALLLLADSAAGRPYEVLVISDGVKDGAPSVYEVPAP